MRIVVCVYVYTCMSVSVCGVGRGVQYGVGIESVGVDRPDNK